MSGRKVNTKSQRRQETEQLTLEDAFTFEQNTGDTRDLHKTLLAVAFLLDEESNFANEPVSPMVAAGLGKILRGCAQKLRDSYQSKHPDFRIENDEPVAVDGQNMIVGSGVAFSREVSTGL